MACYICLRQGVRISAIGPCGKCGRHACGPPPQRRDRQFHGDECSVHGCGLFFCTPHLHTHPHAAGGVSSAFPSQSMVSAVDVIVSVAELESASDRAVALAERPDIIGSFNRYLNIVSPGATTLVEQQERIPPQVFEIVEHDGQDAVIFGVGFFTAEVTAVIAGMALRSIQVSGASLRSRLRQADVEEALAPWRTDLAEHPAAEPVILEGDGTDWLLETLARLPAPTAITANVDELPSESSVDELLLFLLARHDEGEEELKAEALAR